MDTARRTGISHTTIRRWLKDNGIKVESMAGHDRTTAGKRYPMKLRRDACKLYLEGWTMQEISAELSITVNSVHRWLYSAKIKPRSRRTPVDERMIIRLYQSGVSTCEIARRLGTSRKPVKRVLWAHNIPLRAIHEYNQPAADLQKIQSLAQVLLQECVS